MNTVDDDLEGNCDVLGATEPVSLRDELMQVAEPIEEMVLMNWRIASRVGEC